MRNHLRKKIIITGTPGVGKTTIAKAVSKKTGLKYISANQFLIKNKGIKKHVANLKKLIPLAKEENSIIEGHLCCEVKLAKEIIVLRLNPKILEKRLKKRKYSKKKIAENVLSELLDYCTIVSEKKYNKVIQIDCTNKSIQKIVSETLKRKSTKNPEWISRLEESFLKQYMQV